MCGVKQISAASLLLVSCRSMYSATKTSLAELQETANSVSGYLGVLAHVLVMAPSIVRATSPPKELKMDCSAMVPLRRLLHATQPKERLLQQVADLRAWSK